MLELFAEGVSVNNVYFAYLYDNELMLPVFFCLHLEGILKPVKQLVGKLAHILLLREAHFFF